MCLSTVYQYNGSLQEGKKYSAHVKPKLQKYPELDP